MDDVSPLGDAELANRGRDGWLLLYRRYAHRLLAFLSSRRLRESDREDLAQDVWLRAFRARERFTGGQFVIWLFRIAQNALIDLGRKHRPEPADDLEPADRAPAPLDTLIDKEDRERLRHCVAELPEAERAVFLARLGGADCGIEDAGKRAKLMHQAKQRLRACLQRNET